MILRMKNYLLKKWLFNNYYNYIYIPKYNTMYNTITTITIIIVVYYNTMLIHIHSSNNVCYHHH